MASASNQNPLGHSTTMPCASFGSMRSPLGRLNRDIAWFAA